MGYTCGFANHGIWMVLLGRISSRYYIRILAGDKVSLELSPYDLTKGRITFRHIEGRPTPAPAQNTQNRRR